MNDVALTLDGVGKHYKFFDLDDVRLELPHGHILGFIGPNGAGKSTTIRILMGLVHQDRGEVTVLGHPMPAQQAATKWDIGFASEDMRLYAAASLDWHMRFIRVMSNERRSILFSSHNTQDVEQISDQITFIDRGRIIDSRDKETFMDRWRRIRVELPPGVQLPALTGVIDIKQSGRLAVATTNAYDGVLPRAYEAAGIHVQAVETMTLEEIFVQNVQHSREGAHA
jgi:ABC-type multidrug transport system ATPase subunit